MHHDFEKILYEGSITAGAAAVESDSYSLPEGLLMEKVGLWVFYTPADPSNVLTVADLWGTDFIPQTPPYVGASATTTSTCVFTICNPGAGTKLSIQLSSSGSGEDFVAIVARTSVEP